MKLIIAGGRDYYLGHVDLMRLNEIRDQVTEVVCGGATGADYGGKTWGEVHSIPVKMFPADWKKHGRAAGPIRNREMAAYADALAIFPGGKGTANMLAEAKRAGLRVFDWSQPGTCESP